MPTRATCLLLLLAACRREPAPSGSEPGTPPAATTSEPGAPASPSAACVDSQLAAKGLNSFGDPVDTAYAGGTPLFDEKTGQRRDRIEYVLSRRPDIARACAPEKG